MGIEVERAAQSILVVDDEDYVADMLATALDIEGYDVVVAYKGVRAWSARVTLSSIWRSSTS